MKNLGYINDWNKVPPEFENCFNQGHKRERKEIGRCLTEVTCDICKIKYTVDSSD